MTRPRFYTLLLVVVALVLVLWFWGAYLLNPWTRDGQVRANVIQVTPRVTGPIVSLPIRDNQRVAVGDLLFEIDPRTFSVALDQATAAYDVALDNYRALEQQLASAEAQVAVAEAQVLVAQTSIKQYQAEVTKNKAELGRQKELLPQRATSKKSLERAQANYEVSVEQGRGAVANLAQSRADLEKARAEREEVVASLGVRGEANASLRQARAAMDQARLNLEFTQVRASVDGYVTNLNLRDGSQAVADQPALALVDINSYWVHGFFRETVVGDIRPGDKALVTLMSYPDEALEGYVDSLGWGVSQQDGSTGFELLPNIAPTFEWIRLAQRIPVRVHLAELPEGVELRVGTTASVLVKTGTAQDSD